MVNINIRNKKTWNGDGFFVGRPSPLSNPFRITTTQTREIVIRQYGELLKNAIKLNDWAITTALKIIYTRLVRDGKVDLICFCSPKQCHADLIKQVLLNKYMTDNWLTKGNRIGLYGV